MSGVATAIAGAAIIGGVVSYANSQNAADTQSQAAQNANQLQWNEFQQQQAMRAPYIGAGYGALAQMQNPEFQRTFTMQDFQQDPGYAFNLQQGQQAIERAAAAQGGLASGGTSKALAQYSQGLASNEYENAYNRFNNDQSLRFNRLASIAGLGQTSQGQSAQTGINAVNQIGQNTMGAANAQAAAQIAQGNMIGGTISNLGSAYGNYATQQQILNSINNPSNGYASAPNYGSGGVVDNPYSGEYGGGVAGGSGYGYGGYGGADSNGMGLIAMGG